VASKSISTDARKFKAFAQARFREAIEAALVNVPVHERYTTCRQLSEFKKEFTAAYPSGQSAGERYWHHQCNKLAIPTRMAFEAKHSTHTPLTGAVLCSAAHTANHAAANCTEECSSPNRPNPEGITALSDDDDTESESGQRTDTEDITKPVCEEWEFGHGLHVEECGDPGKNGGAGEIMEPLGECCFISHCTEECNFHASTPSALYAKEITRHRLHLKR
jgi:hypothetical protein